MSVGSWSPEVLWAWLTLFILSWQPHVFRSGITPLGLAAIICLFRPASLLSVIHPNPFLLTKGPHRRFSVIYMFSFLTLSTLRLLMFASTSLNR